MFVADLATTQSIYATYALDETEGIVKHPLRAAVAVTAVILAAGSALATDLPVRADASAGFAQERSGKQIRASIVGNTVAGHWSARTMDVSEFREALHPHAQALICPCRSDFAAFSSVYRTAIRTYRHTSPTRVETINNTGVGGRCQERHLHG